jgi:urea transport system ATP-binding protein
MLQVSGLRVAYGQSEVIHGLDIQAARNETLAIMGRNGMGKTTLFKSLIGILQATEGSIKVDDTEVVKMPSHKRVASGLAFVPQGRMIFPNLTVTENIESGLETVKNKRIPDEIYALFPVLHEMRHRKGGNLSGGQQQQLAIARALVSNPKVLLLYEPTEGIQPSVIKDIAKTLNEIRKMREITIIVSEQILSFTMEIADRLLVIESGKIVHEVARENCDEATISRYLSV